MRYFELVMKYYTNESKVVQKVFDNTPKKIPHLHINTRKERNITVPSNSVLYGKEGILVHKLTDYTKVVQTFNLSPDLHVPLEYLIMRGDEECLNTLTLSGLK